MRNMLSVMNFCFKIIMLITGNAAHMHDSGGTSGIVSQYLYYWKTRAWSLDSLPLCRVFLYTL